jgi:hypothetical protein
MEQEQAKKYALLDAKIRELTAQRDALKVEILSSMDKEGVEKLETTYGKFTHAERATWRYSEKVQKLAEKLKLSQVKEQQQGVAVKEVSEYLLFTPTKKE